MKTTHTLVKKCDKCGEIWAIAIPQDLPNNLKQSLVLSHNLQYATHKFKHALEFKKEVVNG